MTLLVLSRPSPHQSYQQKAAEVNFDRAFLRDLARLERLMVRDLAPAFRSLGRRCGGAYILIDARSKNRKIAPGPDPMDVNLVDEILRISRLSAWLTDSFITIMGRNYLRTYEQTFGTVGTLLALGVDLPDIAGQRILREGGTRAGLIDIPKQTKDSIYRALAEGRAAGENALGLAKRIEGMVPGGRFSKVPFDGGEERRALLIARTEIKHSQNGAAIMAYKQTQVVTGVKVLDAQKGDYDNPCISAAGQIWTLTYADEHRIQHPNCTRSFSPIRTG